MLDDEFDPRLILQTIARHWRLIVGAALLAATVTVLIGAALPRHYVATAEVLLRPSASQLALDPRFITTEQIDQRSYQLGMLAIANSDAVAARIPAETLRRVASVENEQLKRRISVKVTGNLITIGATGPRAEVAKELADAWAEAFVGYANEAYGTTAEPSTGEQELRATQARLDAAQIAYEQQLALSPLEQLDHEIATISDTLVEARQADGKRYGAYLDQLQYLDQLIGDTAALRVDLAAGRAVNLADRLAALGLRARATNSGSLPIQLQVTDPALLDGAEDISPARLDALHAQLRAQRQALQESASRLATSIANNTGDAETTLTVEQQSTFFARLRDLQRSREAELAHQQVLRQQRDVALETLQVLQRKLAERHVAASTAEAQARVATTAPLPSQPASRQLAIKSLSALLAGAIVGVLLALMSLRPWGGPDGKRRTAPRFGQTADAELAAS